jgi:hypothetical protein
MTDNEDPQPGLPAPTGSCWCGCGTTVGAASYFAPGHDRIAESVLTAVLLAEMRTDSPSPVARFLFENRYGADRNLMRRAEELDVGGWCPAPECGYASTKSAVANHRRLKRH